MAPAVAIKFPLQTDIFKLRVAKRAEHFALVFAFAGFDRIIDDPVDQGTKRHAFGKGIGRDIEWLLSRNLVRHIGLLISLVELSC